MDFKFLISLFFLIFIFIEINAVNSSEIDELFGEKSIIRKLKNDKGSFKSQIIIRKKDKKDDDKKDDDKKDDDKKDDDKKGDDKKDDDKKGDDKKGDDKKGDDKKGDDKKGDDKYVISEEVDEEVREQYSFKNKNGNFKANVNFEYKHGSKEAKYVGNVEILSINDFNEYYLINTTNCIGQGVHKEKDFIVRNILANFSPKDSIEIPNEHRLIGNYIIII